MAVVKSTFVSTSLCIPFSLTVSILGIQFNFALKKLDNRNAVNKLFTEVAPKFKERNGGYTRIMRLSDTRIGDNTEMAYISFVD